MHTAYNHNLFVVECYRLTAKEGAKFASEKKLGRLIDNSFQLTGKSDYGIQALPLNLGFLHFFLVENLIFDFYNVFCNLILTISL